MNRRSFIKTAGITATMGGLAGCNSSIIDEYYEPRLDTLDQYPLDYEDIQSGKVRLMQRHAQIVGIRRRNWSWTIEFLTVMNVVLKWIEISMLR